MIFLPDFIEHPRRTIWLKILATPLFITIVVLLARLRENCFITLYHDETFRLNSRWLWGHSVIPVMSLNSPSEVRRGARFVMLAVLFFCFPAHFFRCWVWQDNDGDDDSDDDGADAVYDKCCFISASSMTSVSSTTLRFCLTASFEHLTQGFELALFLLAHSIHQTCTKYRPTQGAT